MIVFLRLFFVAVLGSMLWVTSWASQQCALFNVPAEVYTHRWFIATLFDAYWGFLTFYIWVAWRERSWVGRLTWLIAILLLGNLAMAAYCLERLLQVSTRATFAEVVAAPRENSGILGPLLAVAGVSVILLLA